MESRRERDGISRVPFLRDRPFSLRLRGVERSVMVLATGEKIPAKRSSGCVVRAAEHECLRQEQNHVGWLAHGPRGQQLPVVCTAPLHRTVLVLVVIHLHPASTASQPPRLPILSSVSTPSPQSLFHITVAMATDLWYVAVILRCASGQLELPSSQGPALLLVICRALISLDLIQ